MERFVERAHIMGTSHRKPPVRDLVGRIQAMLIELYHAPDGYEVILGNGGASLVWDLATCSLIQHHSAHGVFGEFSRKFAAAVGRSPHLKASVVEAPAGSVALPPECGADTYAVTHNETSTGAMSPVSRIPGGLMLVDATSAAGGTTVDLAETDLYYFAPQKNFASDGGLWLAFASPAAIERAETIASSGRWIPEILSFTAALDNSRKQQTLNTPAIATLLLLEAQLEWLISIGGLTAAATRCERSTRILYDWAERHDFASPFVANPADRSSVVATIDFDEAIDASYLISVLLDNGITDIDPYRSLGRNQLRIGCYAAVDPEDVAALVDCLNYVIERI